MSNWSIFIFVLAAPLSVFLIVAVALAFSESLVAFVISVPVIVVLMIGLYRYLQQKILVTVGQGKIHIRYLRNPFFVTASDMDLMPDDVESYKFDNFSGA
ncbi:MAG: hypothetical protein EBZ77_14915, partial [Chitinophagia bacterium]|nr:hypothetical protein [Chitinophagia bacterium]